MIYRVHYPNTLSPRVTKRVPRPGTIIRSAVHMDDGGGGRTALYKLCHNTKAAREDTFLTDNQEEVTCELCKQVLFKRGVALLRDEELRW